MTAKEKRLQKKYTEAKEAKQTSQELNEVTDTNTSHTEQLVYNIQNNLTLWQKIKNFFHRLMEATL